MKKLLKPLKNKRGTTLIELVVGMIICAIVLAATSAVLAPMLRVFMRANHVAELNSLLDTLSSYIIADMNRASSPTSISGNVITITTNTEVLTYVVNNGVLMRGTPGSINPPPVLAADYYRQKDLVLTATDATTGPFSFTLTILDRDGFPMMSRDFTVNPMGLSP